MFLVLSGIVAGIVSGLGMGGGTILIIILTNLFAYTQHVAQASNILFFIPTSLAALWVHIRDKDIESKIVMKMFPTAIVGGLIGAYISGLVEANRLQKYFGIFLLVVGMYEIVITVKNRFNEKKKLESEEKNDEKFSNRNVYWSHHRWYGRNRSK